MRSKVEVSKIVVINKYYASRIAVLGIYMCNVYITICIEAYITSGHCTVYFLEKNYVYCYVSCLCIIIFH